MSDLSIKLISENEFRSVPFNTSLPSFISLVGLRAPKFLPDEVRDRAGMDIVAVLDRSGSMAGSKMQMVHLTVNLMIDHLKDSDRLSLVSYDDRTEVHTALTKMDKNGKARAKAALTQIKDRGSTDLCGGLCGGLQVLKDRVSDKNEISSVLLLTDGLANHGITDPAEIVTKTQEFLTSMNNPTSIYTFGFGSDHNSALLNSIANSGHGNYYFMKDADSVPPAFADCLGGLMSVIAQNIKLSITPADGVTIKSVSSAFPTVQDGQSHVLTIGDLFSEEERDILVDVVVPTVDGPTPAQPLLLCAVKYLNVITAATENAEVIATVERTAGDSPLGEGSSKVDQQRNRLQTAQAMEEARRLGEQGQLQQAQQLLSVTRDRIAASPSAAISIDLVQDLTSVQAQMQTATQFHAEGAHRLANKMSKHSHQRACESDMGEVQSYATSSKIGVRSLFKK